MIQELHNQCSPIDSMSKQEAEIIFIPAPEEDDLVMIFTYKDAIGDLNDLFEEFYN